MAIAFGSIVVEIAKLRDYCLSRSHPRGRHKARFFRARLGLTEGDAELLRRSLVDAVNLHASDLHATDADAYGQRYALEFTMTTAVGSARIRSRWIVRTGEDVLRFVTCYIVRGRS